MSGLCKFFPWHATLVLCVEMKSRPSGPLPRVHCMSQVGCTLGTLCKHCSDALIYCHGNCIHKRKILDQCWGMEVGIWLQSVLAKILNTIQNDFQKRTTSLQRMFQYNN